MQFTMEAGGIPAGVYRAKFVGAERFEENVEKYGVGVKLRFQVLEGEHAGSEVSRICSMKMTNGSALGKLAVGINCGPLATGQSIDFGQHVGVTGVVVAEATANGGSRVASFQRDQAQPLQPAPSIVQQQPQQQETF